MPIPTVKPSEFTSWTKPKTGAILLTPSISAITVVLCPKIVPITEQCTTAQTLYQAKYGMSGKTRTLNDPMTPQLQ